MELTKPQQEAINHSSSNLQLIACAGSGKTEVVAQRVVALLKTGGLKAPKEILFQLRNSLTI